MVWEFFETLMATRQMDLGKGYITVQGNKAGLMSITEWANLTPKLAGDERRMDSLYAAAKRSVSASIKHTKKVPAEFKEFFKWYSNTLMLTGWGAIELAEFDESAKTGTIYVDSSIVASGMVGKADKPVDHILRGFFAGALSYSFGKDIEVVEEECIANRAKRCKFTFRPAK